VKLIELTVNGLTRQVAASETESLVGVLRREFHTLGVREACGLGICGSCTVLVDGEPRSACLILGGLADGLVLETVEGLGTIEELHPIQQAFVDRSGFQCSYCTPGFILTAKAILAVNPDATREEIREGLAGNLCRCGSYTNILDAVVDAAERLRGEVAGGGVTADAER
jgi:aerobic-type carbon monoxide dehydrogenase small subunit (CoxS/CutS family)